MALHGVLTHRKTRRLARILGVDPWAAMGALEALWHVTSEQQPDGGIGRLSNQDIADEMFFTGDADQLIEAFIDSNWLDRSEESHRLYVHDWHAACDDSTKVKLARRGRRFANGVIPDMHRLSERERERCMALYSDTEQDTPQPVRTKAHKSALPEPVPEPGPVPEPVPEPGPVLTSPSDDGLVSAQIAPDSKSAHTRRGSPKSKQPVLSREGVIEDLQAKPAFTGMNVPREYDKCDAWCSVNNKRMSKRRLANWLLRADIPIPAGSDRAKSRRPSLANAGDDITTWDEYKQRYAS